VTLIALDAFGTFGSTGVTSLSFSSPLLEAAEAERDAAIAEKATAETSLANAREARTGSTVIDLADVVIDGATTQVANITLTVEQTSDVSDWSSAATSDHTIQLNAPDGASFYRFKMTE
jgi:2-methylaconitate cis-trans-isomerase PrpF